MKKTEIIEVVLIHTDKERKRAIYHFNNNNNNNNNNNYNNELIWGKIEDIERFKKLKYKIILNIQDIKEYLNYKRNLKNKNLY